MSYLVEINADGFRNKKTDKCRQSRNKLGKGKLRLVCRTRCVVGVWCQVCGGRCAVLGVWCQVCGNRCVAPGVSHQVCGAWCVAEIF